MKRLYMAYITAIFAAALIAGITLLTLAAVPHTGFILYHVFNEGAGTGEYMFLFLVISLSALPVFCWVHDHLPYSSMYFFPKLAAFNLQWRENPERRIDSYISPKGNLTRKGKPNWEGDHSDAYDWFPPTIPDSYR